MIKTLIGFYLITLIPKILKRIEKLNETKDN